MHYFYLEETAIVMWGFVRACNMELSMDIVAKKYAVGSWSNVINKAHKSPKDGFETPLEPPANACELLSSKTRGPVRK